MDNSITETLLGAKVMTVVKDGGGDPAVRVIGGLGPCYEVTARDQRLYKACRVAFETVPMVCPFCGKIGRHINGWFLCSNKEIYVWFVPEPQRFFVPTHTVSLEARWEHGAFVKYGGRWRG